MTTTPSAGAQSSEQRREKRYKVNLWGELRFTDGALPVRIGDLSVSGALLYLDSPPPRGAVVTLYIEQFGEIEIEIMHSGEAFCGVAMRNPAAHRMRLMDFLRQETVVDSATGWAAHAGPE
jgi:hypothetical protein